MTPKVEHTVHRGEDSTKPELCQGLPLPAPICSGAYLLGTCYVPGPGIEDIMIMNMCPPREETHK